jgi:hypothetical protein
VLAVYAAVEAAGVLTVPSHAFQRFCFFKTLCVGPVRPVGAPMENVRLVDTACGRYMAKMAAAGVPVAPTLVLRAADLGGGVGSVPPAGLVAAAAATLAEEVVALAAEGWAGPVAAARCLGGGGPPGLRVEPGQLFLKGDSGWCRKGNLTLGPDWAAPGGFAAGVGLALGAGLERLLRGDRTAGVQTGLSRIVALYHPASTPRQIEGKIHRVDPKFAS